MVTAMVTVLAAVAMVLTTSGSAARAEPATTPTTKSAPKSSTAPTTSPSAGPAVPATKTAATVKSSASASAGKAKSKPKSKSTFKAAVVARTASGRLRPTATAPKSVAPGKVATTWSVQQPLAGWERLRDIDWPVAGEALGAVSRKSSLDVRRGPSVGEPGLRFAKGRSSTGPVTFLVVQDYGNWLQVAIPVRPNGTVGWVQSADVQRLNLEFRVVVDLSTNSMIVERSGQEVYRESVSAGTGNTPTPTGLFFVREVVKESENGPYGPYVFGLSGYSDVLVSFKGGEGAIGIHGTDAPGLIGSNASFGCVRITNASIRNLVRLLPLGTPVEIVGSFADLPTTRRSRGAPDLEVFADEVVGENAAEATGTDINNAPTYNAEAIDFIDVPATSEADDLLLSRPGE
jgi:lipoprotein-anchoring transpeptidase ErfK/SrfK